MNRPRRSLFTVILLTAACCFIFYRHAPSQTVDPFERLRQAEQLLLTGNNAVGLQMLRQILESNPPAPIARQARFDTARACEALGQIETAAGIYRSIYEQSPDAPDADNALYQSGRLLLAANRSEESIRTYQLLLRAFPASPYASPTRFVLADMYTDDPDKAVAVLEPLLKSNAPQDTAAARRRLADLYMRLERFSAAEAAFIELLKSEPGNIYYLTQLATAYEKENRFAQAIDIYEAIARDHPADKSYREKCYALYDKAGVLSKKIDDLDALKTKHPTDPEPWFELSRVYLWAKRPVDALRELEGGIERQPGNLEATVTLAKLYFENHWENKSVETLRALLEKNPGFSPAWRQLGDILHARGDNDAARSAWEKSVAFNPADQATYAPLAGIYLSLGMHVDAAALYEQGRRALNNPDAFAVDLANLYEVLMRYNDAFSEYIRMVNASGNDMGLSSRIVSMALRPEVKEFALASLKDRTAANPGNNALWLLLAEIHLGLGSPADALETLRESTRKFPSEPDLFAVEAKRLTDRGHCGDALPFYEAAAGAEKDSAVQGDLLFQAAVCAADADATDKSVALFRDLLKRFPNDAHADAATFRLAQQEEKQADFAGASGLYARIVKDFPTSAWGDAARMGQARSDFRLGNYDAAAKFLETFSSLPSAFEYNDEITWLRGEMALFKGDFNKAEEFYRKIPDSWPESRFVRDALFRLLFLGDVSREDPASARTLAEAMRLRSTGRSDDAASLLNGLATLAPDTSIAAYATYELAGIRMEQNRAGDAVSLYRRLAASAANDELRQRALFRIAGAELDAGQKDDALRDYQKLQSDFPDGYWSAEARRKLETKE